MSRFKHRNRDTQQKYRLSPIVIALLSTMVGSSYAAQNDSLPRLASEMSHKQQGQELKRQGKLIEAQGQAINQLKSQLEALKKSPPSNSKTIVKPKPRKNIVKNKPKPKVKIKPVGKAPPKKSASANVPDLSTLNNKVGGVLTSQGSFIFEPSIGYSYSDNYRVFLDGYTFIPALVIGVIDLREVKRHSFITSLAARYGISDRWEVEMKLPFIGRKDSQRSRPVNIDASRDEIFSASGQGLGDLELSTRFQINSGSDGGPIYVANLAATIPTGHSPFDVEYVTSVAGSQFPTELPTGSGYVSIQPSISAMFPTDPGVLFGNLNYGYNMATDEEVGKFDPGDSVGFSFGLGLALNERTSLSLSYSHKHVLKSTIDGEKISGSELDIGQLIVGYSFRYSLQTNVSLSVGIGTTDDAPDLRLTLRFPMKF